MTAFRFALAPLLLTVVGCASADKGAPEAQDITGAWRWSDHEPDSGSGEMTLVFGADGRMDVDLAFADAAESQRMGRTGAYRMESGRLISGLISKGEPVRIWISGGKLYMESGGEVSGPFRKVRL